jgi:hypothetical protein
MAEQFMKILEQEGVYRNDYRRSLHSDRAFSQPVHNQK